MVTSIGLYYPYTHFHDRAWLKLAALYWPNMARIAPLGYSDGDNRDARVLREELDFILDLGPRADVLVDASARVSGALREHGPDLVDRYRIPIREVHTVGGASSAGERRVEYRFPDLDESVRVENPARRWPEPVRYPVPESFGRLIGLHSRKISRRLGELLVATNLAVFDSDHEYAAVHPNFAWAYMCMLADEVAEREGLVAVSDDLSAYGACGTWTAERFASALLGQDLEEDQGEADPYSRVGMLALRIAVPVDPAAVPVEKIVKIRRRYAAEFDAFHDLVSASGVELSAELEGIRDTDVLEAYLEQEVSRRFERPLEDLRRAMRGLGVDTVLGATSLKFEFPAAAALAAGWAAGQPVVAAAGAAFGLGAWYRAARAKRHGEIRNSPVGYLWRIEKRLKGAELMRRMVNPFQS
ncbi:DUF6236 family protein [Glycomyces salinus]|uniref:DUF6236 family protein n=1 Tax=Glycomyces salinus TaxID=980294 RepID=UPI0018EC17C9|nr:DUF6236 family protein [Glycomyces salinus]